MSERTARDVLADRIETWAADEDWHVYDYVDRLIKDLHNAGFEIVPAGTPTRDDLCNVILRFHDESWKTGNERSVVISNIEWTETDQDVWRYLLGPEMKR